MLSRILMIVSMCLTGLSPVYAIDHQPWDRLLAQHVTEIEDGSVTEVDYAAFSHDREALKAYLSALEAVDKNTFDDWSRDRQLVFLINAYNAWTVELILSEYPDLDSIKDLGGFFRSPWGKDFIPLFGEKVSLDHIEHELIRGCARYQEPRIHFAVNCASVGCPALRNEAYNEAKLNDQLEQQTRLFLADDSRNRLEDDQLLVSEIFKWYQEDFEQGWRDAETLAEFLSLYAEALSLTDSQKAALQKGRLEIDFLDYDWALNDTK